MNPGLAGPQKENLWGVDHLISRGVIAACLKFKPCLIPSYNRFKAHFPGLPWSASARRNLLDFVVQGEISEADTSTIPAGRHSIQANQQCTSLIAPLLRPVPFLPQPSQFILAWDRHQICWFAYPVAYLRSTSLLIVLQAGYSSLHPTVSKHLRHKNIRNKKMKYSQLFVESFYFRSHI